MRKKNQNLQYTPPHDIEKIFEYVKCNIHYNGHFFYDFCVKCFHDKNYYFHFDTVKELKEWINKYEYLLPNHPNNTKFPGDAFDFFFQRPISKEEFIDRVIHETNRLNYHVPMEYPALVDYKSWSDDVLLDFDPEKSYQYNEAAQGPKVVRTFNNDYKINDLVSKAALHYIQAYTSSNHASLRYPTLEGDYTLDANSYIKQQQDEFKRLYYLTYTPKQGS